MRSFDEIMRHECGTESIDCGGKLLTPIIVNINHSHDMAEYISVAERGEIGNKWWYISVYSPEYILMNDTKMSEEEKEEFLNMIKSNWDIIIDMFENNCEELCGDDKHFCNHYLNRNIPKNPPDYNLL